MNILLHTSSLESSNQKKSFFLLLCSIFYYHDMEERERNILLDFASEFKAKEELDWACEFVKRDVITAFKRSKVQVKKLLVDETMETKLGVLSRIWDTTKNKGYITEIEANLLLGLARDWQLESELINLVREA